eukprot:362000-Chlamydomonas_euryale.AAC.3
MLAFMCFVGVSHLEAAAEHNSNGSDDAALRTRRRHTRILEDLRGDLREHMQRSFRLGSGKQESVYYTAWAGLANSFLAHGEISNGFVNSTVVTYAERRTALRWRTGTLFNDKLAARTNRKGSDMCPLCMHPDVGMHIASGCTHPTMQKICTERHNKVGRQVLKSIHKDT